MRTRAPLKNSDNRDLKGFLTAGILLTLATLLAPAHAWEANKTTMYFLRDEVASQWCGYRSKDAWTSDARRAVSTMMGYVEEAGSVREVNVRQQDSTADWLVDDRYTLDAEGRIIGLKRTIVYFSDDERKETSYRIRDGRVETVRSAAYSLKTGASLRLPLPTDAYESWKIFTRPEEFPFVRLLKQSPKVTRTGSYCVAE